MDNNSLEWHSLADPHLSSAINSSAKPSRAYLFFLPHFALRLTQQRTQHNWQRRLNLSNWNYHHASHRKLNGTFTIISCRNRRPWLPSCRPRRHPSSPIANLVSSRPYRGSCEMLYTICFTKKSLNTSINFNSTPAPSLSSFGSSVANSGWNTMNDPL